MFTLTCYSANDLAIIDRGALIESCYSNASLDAEIPMGYMYLYYSCDKITAQVSFALLSWSKMLELPIRSLQDVRWCTSQVMFDNLIIIQLSSRLFFQSYGLIKIRTWLHFSLKPISIWTYSLAYFTGYVWQSANHSTVLPVDFLVLRLKFKSDLTFHWSPLKILWK